MPHFENFFALFSVSLECQTKFPIMMNFLRIGLSKTWNAPSWTAIVIMQSITIAWSRLRSPEFAVIKRQDMSNANTSSLKCPCLQHWVILATFELNVASMLFPQPLAKMGPSPVSPWSCHYYVVVACRRQMDRRYRLQKGWSNSAWSGHSMINRSQRLSENGLVKRFSRTATIMSEYQMFLVFGHDCCCPWKMFY